MRRVLAFVTSRYGLAGLAALAVVVVVLVGRLMGIGGGGDDSGGALTGQGDRATSTESPVPNDAPTGAPTEPDPVVKPGQDGPLAVAKKFADAYLASDVPAKTWRASVTRYATKRLTSEIASIDPATVPAKRLTGSATLGHHGANWADVELPTDAGKLTFTLVSGSKSWQVDRIDWKPTP